MMIVIVTPLSLMLLFQAKQVHPGADGGGADDVEAVGNKALAPGLLHYLIEQILKAFRPQSVPQALAGREIGGRFLGAHAQEPLIDQVKGNLRLHLGIRQIIEELQQHHFAHQHWVPCLHEAWEKRSAWIDFSNNYSLNSAITCRNPKEYDLRYQKEDLKQAA